MIIIGNKTFRNLEEQVQYLTEYMQSATPIKPDGRVTYYANLPTASAHAGEVYAVGGATPFDYYASIGGAWVYLGVFPKAGPAGPQGPEGPSPSLDEYATIQYVDDSVTGLVTMDEVNDAVDDRVPAPLAQDVGKYLYAVAPNAATWQSANFEAKGYTTAGGTTYANVAHTVTIVTNGVTTTFTLFGT